MWLIVGVLAGFAAVWWMLTLWWLRAHPVLPLLERFPVRSVRRGVPAAISMSSAYGMTSMPVRSMTSMSYAPMILPVGVLDVGDPRAVAFLPSSVQDEFREAWG